MNYTHWTWVGLAFNERPDYTGVYGECACGWRSKPRAFLSNTLEMMKEAPVMECVAENRSHIRSRAEVGTQFELSFG